MEKCQKINRNEIFILDVFVHVFILLLVLTLFFNLVIAIKERHGLNDQVQRAIRDAVYNISPWNKSTVEAAVNKVNRIFEDINDADSIYNDSLRNYSFFSIGLIFVCMIAVWLSMKYSAHKCPNLGRLIAINLLIFAIVGIIEYLFFVNYAQDFSPIKPSYLINELNNQLN